MSHRPRLAIAAFFLVALASMFTFTGSASAQVDPGYAIRIDCPMEVSAADEGDSIEVKVYYTAAEAVGAFSLGFKVNSPDLDIAGISPGPLLGSWFIPTVLFNPTENTALYGGLTFNPAATIPPATDQYLFSFWVRVPVGVQPQCASIDSIFVAPGGVWNLTTSVGGVTSNKRPDFIACGGEEINVKGGCDAAQNNPPVALCQPITVDADENCQANANIDNGSNDPDGDAITIVQVPAGPYPLGETMVSLIVSDGEFADTCDALVTVNDNTDPQVNCPADIVVGNDAGVCGAVVNFAATATDNCSDPVTIVYSQDPGTEFPIGTTTVTVTATDDAGNSAQCTFDVTVNDTEAPVVTCPDDVTVVAAGGATTAVVNFSLNDPTDNCPGATVSSEPASGTEFALGTTSVTVTAEDAAGNTTQCSFDVTVQAPPVVADIPDQTIDQGGSFAQINLDDFVEDLDNADTEITWSAGLFKSLGEITVDIVDRVATINVTPDFTGSAVFEFTATDPDGNSDSDQATFTVNTPENEPPVVADIPDQTVTSGDPFVQINLDDYVSDPDNADNEISWTSAGANQLTVAIVDRVATITYPGGFTGAETVTFTAADPGGLFDSDQATFTVNAVPNEPPVVSDIPDQTIDSDGAFAFIPLDDYVTDPDNTDEEMTWVANELSNTAGVSVTIDANRVAMPTFTNVGVATFEFVATDPGGLSDADTVTFTVNEALNPDFEVLASPDSIFVPEGTATDFAYNVTVNAIDGFTGDVTLSVSGLPAGVGAAFDTNPVSVPGSSILEGTTADDTPAGVYELEISGATSAKIVDPHVAYVYLVVEEQGCIDPPVPMVSANQFDITITEGENAADEMFYVTNGASCGTLFWQAMSTEAWVSPDPTSGSVDAGVSPGDEVTLSFTTAALEPGDYTAQINVVSVLPGAGKSDEGAAVVINLTVEPMGESADTVYVSSASAYPGGHAAIEINFKNDEELAALSLGLMWDSGDVTLDSVSYAGSRVAYISSKVTTINNAQQQLALGVLRVPPEALIPAGSGLWATLHYTVDPAASPQFVMIDSTFIPPGVELLFNDDMANAIYPQFVKGQIEILPAQDVCISGIVKDPSGTPIPGATVILFDDFGNQVDMTTSDASGFYEFCVDGSMMGDLFHVRAYGPGYYPGSEDAFAPEDDADVVLAPLAQVVQPTFEWVDLFCDGGAYGIDGPVLPGDVIEAYDPDGVLCGREVVDQVGTFGFMPVYVDDPFTPGIDEGCEVGDEITLMWNGNPVLLTGTPNPLIWTGNGDRYSACFEVETQVTKCIELHQGWNLISFNVSLPTSDIEDFFADVMDNVDVILSFESVAQTYDPDLPQFSTLWNVDNFHGYWVRMDVADEICFTGDLVDAATPIELELNWNLVSYLPVDPMSPPDALASIWQSVIVVLGYDGGGLTYDPAHPELSNLEEMAECFGYWIKTNSAGTLIYEGVPVFAGGEPDATQTLASYVPRVNVTNTWVNLYGSDVTFNGQTLKAGAVISAYNEAGALIGETTLRQDGKFGFMPIYGPENFSADFAKIANAGKVSFKVDGVDVVQTIDWTANGDRIELSQFSTEKGSTLPTSFTLEQNYPNPFNPETSIQYTVAAAGNVRIEIYNMLGQKIRTLVDDQHAVGTYTVTWHGRTDSGSQVASGIYLYKMVAGDYSETRKMTLLK